MYYFFMLESEKREIAKRKKECNGKKIQETEEYH